MSSSLPKSSEGHLAEHHLGDRLSALVDGELGHDARERVLAHVATCAKCKTEVDEQRRLKTVFAAAAPPPPSESLLARLQGLPAGGGFGDGASPLGGSALPGGSSGRFGPSSGVFGARRAERFEFAYAPVRGHQPPAAAAAAGDPDLADRHAADRPSSRGLRLAFVAAGAVSLAAIALGGVTTVTPVDAEARGQGKGSNVTPMRTQGAGAATTPESRRRGVGPLLGQVAGGQSGLGAGHVVPTGVAAPLLPGIPAPPQGGATAMSPLIRPLNATPPLGLSAWATAVGLKAPGLVTAAPSPAPAPTHSSGTVR
ncbi:MULTISPECIES: anti-sigma factor family protein [Streptomyces]|uniref:Zf-HC2 domain-containing protein n=1 Tax=Streptomyces tendae TaxID=1932 RepID=A0ABX5ZLP9_STRTE|nr:zf-HC2 domain-containing protein [Streptomyces tendae]QER85358.1 zf-HC2 domain-containing protein [Streptomyces tendae]